MTGAGIVLMGSRSQTLIGASDAEVAVAEQWHFTIGEDPYRVAFDRGAPVVAHESALRRHFVELHRRLRRHTPFRSVAVLPLGDDSTRVGVVAFYFDESFPTAGFDVQAARPVARAMHAELLAATPPRPRPAPPRPAPPRP